MISTKCTKCKHHSKLCDEIAKKRPGNSHNAGETLCWCCKNAVPYTDPVTGLTQGCEWSLYRQQVPGWDVSCIALINRGDGKMVRSYIVENCPSFERG